MAALSLGSQYAKEYIFPDSCMPKIRYIYFFIANPLLYPYPDSVCPSVCLSICPSASIFLCLGPFVLFVCLSLSLSFAGERLGVYHEVIWEIDHKISRLPGEYLASFAYPEWFTFSLYVCDEHGNIAEK